MKTKYFLIYVFVGIAFLAVSAWVFFSRGKNAKAIRAKYKLGGIMLACMAMLSVASCGEILNPGEVMCYDPDPGYSIKVSTENHDASWQYSLSPGELLTVDVDCGRYTSFTRFDIVIRKFAEMKEGDVLQSASFESGGEKQFQYKLMYDPADKKYAGYARVDFWGYPEGDEEGYQIGASILLITTGAD